MIVVGGLKIRRNLRAGRHRHRRHSQSDTHGEFRARCVRFAGRLYDLRRGRSRSNSVTGRVSCSSPWPPACLPRSLEFEILRPIRQADNFAVITSTIFIGIGAIRGLPAVSEHRDARGTQPGERNRRCSSGTPSSHSNRFEVVCGPLSSPASLVWPSSATQKSAAACARWRPIRVVPRFAAIPPMP